MGKINLKKNVAEVESVVENVVAEVEKVADVESVVEVETDTTTTNENTTGEKVNTIPLASNDVLNSIKNKIGVSAPAPAKRERKTEEQRFLEREEKKKNAGFIMDNVFMKEASDTIFDLLVKSGENETISGVLADTILNRMMIKFIYAVESNLQVNAPQSYSNSIAWLILENNRDRAKEKITGLQKQLRTYYNKTEQVVLDLQSVDNMPAAMQYNLKYTIGEFIPYYYMINNFAILQQLAILKEHNIDTILVKEFTPDVFAALTSAGYVFASPYHLEERTFTGVDDILQELNCFKFVKA